LEFAAGAFWALCAAVICSWLWRRRPDAAQKTVWLIGAFSLYSLARLVIYAQSDYDRGRLPFLTIGLVSLVVVLLGIQWRSSRKQSTEM
jgi:prolipoprotein diacylglyceryltransferase